MKHTKKQVSFRLKPLNQSKGATLLEVMISVFIMAFGIMALMLAQVKSVGSVREAEMQTRVAQAVQNLSEGMLANADARAQQTDPLVFTRYNTAQVAVAPNTVCPVGAMNAPATRICGQAPASQQEMAQCHVQTFQTDLVCALPNASNIAYSITSAGNATTIAVRWTETTGKENTDAFTFQYSAVVGN